MSIFRHLLETESQLRFQFDHTIRATEGDPHCIAKNSIRIAGHSSC